MIQITPDLDPQNNIMGYQVTLAYKAPFDPKAWKAPVQVGSTFWKHLIHVFVSKEQWHDQYKVNTDYHVTVSDVGEVTIKKLM